MLRFSHYVCYDKSRNERADFYGRFWQGQMPLHATQASSALYANLANAMFARFYAKLSSRAWGPRNLMKITKSFVFSVFVSRLRVFRPC
jgi:hypothetical protein